MKWALKELRKDEISDAKERTMNTRNRRYPIHGVLLLNIFNCSQVFWGLFFITFFTPITGCVSQVAKLEQEWLGKDRSTLIDEIGTPDQIMDDGSGGQIYTYIEISTYTTPMRSTTQQTGRIYTSSGGWQHSGEKTTYNGGKTYTKRTTTMFWLDSEAKIYKISVTR